MMTKLLAQVAFALSIIAILTLEELDDTVQQQADLYCEMVEIHKDTGGEYGWPDFNDNYDEVCK